MRKLVAATITLTAVVAAIVVVTSLTSSAQEDGGSGDTTSTTLPDRDLQGHFGFRFDGDRPPEVDEFLSCLRDEGIDVPEDVDGSFLFGLGGEDFDGLAEALEACGLPGLGPKFDFPDRFGFGDGFPFRDRLPDGFPFGEGFDFEDGFPFGEGFPFDGEGFDFEFRFGPPGLNRDELASCLFDLGSFDSFDEVRGMLDECLPAHTDLDDLDLEGYAPFRGHRRDGSGFYFGGSFGFHGTVPDLEGTSS